jgi:CheY-like chemotaxis protein
MMAVVKPNQVHWFGNDTDANFSFVAFWAPPHRPTVAILAPGLEVAHRLALLGVERTCYNDPMVKKRNIRVLIADDFDILRQVMHKLLERAEDIEVVGESPDLKEALKEARTLEPDVIIMNDYLPPINSAHATERFRAMGVSAAILIISMHVEPDLIRRSLACGANGMGKEEMGERLLDAVRYVHEGGTYLSPKAERVPDNTED